MQRISGFKSARSLCSVVVCGCETSGHKWSLVVSHHSNLPAASAQKQIALALPSLSAQTHAACQRVSAGFTQTHLHILVGEKRRELYHVNIASRH